MAPLRLVGAMLPLAISSPNRAAAITQWEPYIAEASQRFGVPAPWIKRVILAESGGETMLNRYPIRSRVGAMGLMQLMPATWQMLRRSLSLGANPDDPHDNILAGTFYLRLMYDRFGYPGLFAAYNAGPTRFAAYLASARALPAETIAYLRKLGRGNVRVARTAPNRDGGLLLVAQDGPETQKQTGPFVPSLATLFAVRNDDR